MSELVDQLVSNSSPETADTPTTSEQQNGEAKRQSRYDKRIGQLNREKQQLAERFYNQRNEIADLREKMARMEGQLSTQTPASQPEPSSWAEMSEAQLQDAFAMAEEQGNSAAKFNALREISRRDAQGVSEKTLEHGKSELKKQEHARSMLNSIVQTFGSEAQDRDSELTQRASQYASAMQQEYGQNALTETPWLERAAFLEAQREQWVKDKERLSSLEKEVERMKAQQGMPTGGHRVAPMANESKSALESGEGAKQAIRKLGLIQSMEGK